MTELEIEPKNPGGMSLTNIHHLEMVRAVIAYMQDTGCPTFKEACLKLGYNRVTLWRALQDPWVQQDIISQYVAGNTAILEYLDQSIIAIVGHLIQLATQAKGQVAVDAAKLLVAMRKDMATTAVTIPAQEKTGISAAKLILEGMKRPKALRRTTITEEIELEDAETLELVSVGNGGD